MVKLEQKKLLKMGKGSYGITIPKEIALEYINSGKDKVWIGILCVEEIPSDEEIRKWIFPK